MGIACGSGPRSSCSAASSQRRRATRRRRDSSGTARSCRLPYPKEMVACPNCGASEQARGGGDAERPVRRDLPGGMERPAPRSRCSRRRSSMGRTADAERILRRATAQVEERLARWRAGAAEAAAGALDGGCEDEPRPRGRDVGVVGGPDSSAHVHGSGGAGRRFARRSRRAISRRRLAPPWAISRRTAAGSSCL